MEEILNTLMVMILMYMKNTCNEYNKIQSGDEGNSNSHNI